MPILALCFALLVAVLAPAYGQLPPGWSKTTSTVDYEAGVDRSVAHSGQASAFVKMKPGGPMRVVGLIQSIRADRYRGKRVQFSGFVRTQDVTGRARLFLQVDGERGTLGLDSMDDRTIRGTTEWQRYTIVLDVPKQSVGLDFGLLINGPGQAWMDDLRLEVVGDDVSITVPGNGVKEREDRNDDEARDLVRSYSKRPTRPVNLDFES
jgi:hypothetical protein